MIRMAMLLAALLLGLGGAAHAQDDPPGRVGRIAAVDGNVSVFDAEVGDWVDAHRNRPLTQGDRLATGALAGVELRIGSTTLLLGAASELEALRLDDERMVFQLHRGVVALHVRSREVAQELEVHSAEGGFVPLSSGLYRVERRDDTSSAAVWRGQLQFVANDLSLELHAGQRAEFWVDANTTRSRWAVVVDDAFAQRVLALDQAEARSLAERYVSAEMTGAEELDRHGRWQQHPEYGAVWSPTVVAVGWVPYRFGQWAWLRPWGWTWVDDAPWGFAPSHYGRWLWWGGRWCWAPGPRVARPVYAPALVGWVGGGGVQVTVGARPVVAWVPLAPREAYRPGYRASARYLDRINGHGHLAPSGHGNKVVPGAVTIVPSQSLLPRQPVARLHRDDRIAQHLLQGEAFRHDAPGRPAFAAPREQVPRGTAPMAGLPQAAPAERQRPAPDAPLPSRPPMTALPVGPSPSTAAPLAVAPATPPARPAPHAAPAPRPAQAQRAPAAPTPAPTAAAPVRAPVAAPAAAPVALPAAPAVAAAPPVPVAALPKPPAAAPAPAPAPAPRAEPFKPPKEDAGAARNSGSGARKNMAER